MQFLFCGALLLALQLPGVLLLSGQARVPGGSGLRGTRVGHDFGTGDLGDETWRGVDGARDGIVDAVTFVPDDYSGIVEAIEQVLHRQQENVHGKRTVISVRPGSYLMPRRFREVACPDGKWPYYLSHYPRYLDGKKTCARIPDDGAEPKISEDRPCR